jgi:hypothetical protein
MTEQVLQIIPTPPNSVDGIGDYAFLLANQMLMDAQIETHFLVFRNDLDIALAADRFPTDRFSIAQLPTHRPEVFRSLIPQNIRAIIIHFSGYPYFNTSLKGMLGVGTPFWLVDTLQSIQQSRKLKLVVMFHELPKLHLKQFYFFGALNPIHSIVARHLCQVADTVLTTSAKYESILTRWVKKPVFRIPIFSNMGEPDLVPALTERKRRMVVFGGTSRQRVYQNAVKELIEICHALGIEEICDIGPSLNLQTTYRFDDISLVEMGFQSREIISQILLESVAGCLDYTPFPGDLSKSGVFAAYCAHGMVPIITRYNPSEPDGLYIDRQYLALDRDSMSFNSEQLRMVSHSAYQWYQGHSLQEISKMFALHIFDNE